MKTYPTTLIEIKAALKAGDFTAVELAEATFSFIEESDKKLNAFITLNKEAALEAAKEADERGYNNEEFKLNGIPIAVKDNILTAGLRTTAASKMLEDFVPMFDATVVKRLKEAGAVIIGKVNMDEFAMGSSGETSYFGKTHNPWDLERIPGGSSSGSATTVAGGQVPAALGTDTGGSIRQPAAFTATVGIKPTYGTVSRYGVVAFGSSLDQVGPITHTVEDNALMLEVLAGQDEMDYTTKEDLDTAYSALIGQDLKGLKIAFPKEFKSDAIDPEIRETIQEAATYFESKGAQVEEVSLPTSMSGVNAYYLISSAEAASNLARFDGIRYGYRSKEVEDLEDIYINSRSEGFGQEVKRRIILGTFAVGSGRYEDFYYKAAQVRTLIRREFMDVLEEYDLILGPVTTTTAFKMGDRKEDQMGAYLADLLTVTSNLVGVPALSMPAGFSSEGMPIGLQLIGRPFEEKVLYQVGHQFESDHDYADRRAEY